MGHTDFSPPLASTVGTVLAESFSIIQWREAKLCFVLKFVGGSVGRGVFQIIVVFGGSVVVFFQILVVFRHFP